MISINKSVVAKEKFKGSNFFKLINHNQLVVRNMTPIKIEQTTLIKYLPELHINPLITDEMCPETDSIDRSYTLRMTPDNTVYIKETHCLRCGKRLVKNGNNSRVIIQDMGGGRQEFRLHRKRCKRCGEIMPDYSKIAPKYGNYHKNYKHRARQHYLEGLNPAQIKRVFKIDFGIEVSKSSIVNWVNQAARPLRKLLRNTPIPSSGYWGYDEIHMNMRGKKKYTLTTVDLNTGFIPVARVKPKMGKKSGRKLLIEGRRNATLPIYGLVKDCTANLGKLFKTRSFKNIELQNCLTHVKWIVSAHVKAFAGMAKRSKKPVPKKWRWLLYRFYAFLDVNYEADAYIQLEAIRGTVRDLNGERISELITAIKQLEVWLPKLIAHLRNPLLPATNNMTEGFHKKYEYYRAFKTQMMTEEGAQRVLDYRIFGHNIKQFPRYIHQYKVKHETWRVLMRDCTGDAILRGQGNHFRSIFRKLDKWYGKYRNVWDEFFAIKKE